MTFAQTALSNPRPAGLGDFALPRRRNYHPSPADWRDEVLYFLMVDRFSDGQEDTRPLLDRANLAAARPAAPDGTPWRWDRWAQSGTDRWQGGTLAGVTSKLPYLRNMGITAIWLSPVFMQRGHQNNYHGYAIQDFLDIDPRFGTRDDVVTLVGAAHNIGLRVILDVIFNHSGENWVYPGGVETPPYTTGRYDFGAWLGNQGQMVDAIQTRDDGVWPTELQNKEWYTRAGSGSLSAGNIDDYLAEHKRTDFGTLRDFLLDAPGTLTALARCYKYWIALTDCDGFRIDTLKHVTFDEARNFCGTIKEYAANLGKTDFFLVGEVAGGNTVEESYLNALGRNLNAALDIGEMRLALRKVAKGFSPGSDFFGGFFATGDESLGSHRNVGSRHVSILDDHDHVWGEKLRFSTDAASDHQVFAGVALQLLTLGIPCIYYGTEQAFTGPEPSARQWLPDWSKSDRYLREAMFGPPHPRQSGRDGLGLAPGALDPALPGFGPFGTAGCHCFDPQHPAYRRIAALAALRAQHFALRCGRQYPRQTSNFGWPFDWPGAGELIAWSRVLDDEEVLCALNAHGTEARGADVIVDASLNPPDSVMTVIHNSADAAPGTAAGGAPSAGTPLPVKRRLDGTAYVELRGIPPSEVLVLANHPRPEDGGLGS